MLILGIDTSSPATSLALVEDGEVRALFHKEHDHPPSDAAFSILDALLRDEGLAVPDIDVFAACEGPGSFTGLRIGLGMAKTFAFALKKPVLGIDSITAAAAAIARSRHLVGPFGTVVRGFKSTCFVGRYDGDGESVRASSEPDYTDGPEDLEVFVKGGAGPVLTMTELPWPIAGVEVVADTEPLAVAIARLAAARVTSGTTPDFEAVQPRYLKPFNIGRKARRPEDLR